VTIRNDRKLYCGVCSGYGFHQPDCSIPEVNDLQEQLDEANERLELALKYREHERIGIYAKLRGNMPCVRVTRVFGQYDAHMRLSIVLHKSARAPEAAKIKSVTWNLGDLFTLKTVTEAPFVAEYFYYGGVLAQAQIEFEDGDVALGYVYVPMPE
jgi:hypothetical protein